MMYNCYMEDMNDSLFYATLSQHRLSRTRERVALFYKLKKLDAPCTITDLAEQLSDIMNRSTVYRTIDLFEKIKITKRVYSGFKYTIELSDQFSPHHHHFTCTNCGTVISFLESQPLMNEFSKLEGILNSRITSHSLELRGLCRNCY
jgi:Fur family transcriptional regulator, ferric uptake regulator